MGEETEIEEIVDEKPSTSTQIVKKEPKRGIIYLSSIPPYMNVSKIREFFAEFGKVGRVYLQLEDLESKSNSNNVKKKKKRKTARKFTEGWVEFERKSLAKKVVTYLNNKQVSTRKKSKQYDVLWNIKYLSNFKWMHLHERLSFEKMARRQKLKNEIESAKKSRNLFGVNLSKAKKNKNKPKDNESEEKNEVMETSDN